MSKTIVFKKEFEDKLKELKIKTKFVKNVKDDCKRHDYSLQKRLYELNSKTYWFNFINNAFWWHMTPEGHAYWDVIADFYADF